MKGVKKPLVTYLDVKCKDAAPMHRDGVSFSIKDTDTPAPPPGRNSTLTTSSSGRHTFRFGNPLSNA